LLERTDLTQERRIIRAIEIANSMNAARMPQPPPLEKVCIMAPLFTRTEVRERIKIRLEQRLENEGLIEEVQNLHRRGVPYSELEWFGLEYRYIAQFLAGKISENEMREVLLNRIRQFAKRQDIWFRKLQREGHHIQWIPQGNVREAEKYLRSFLEQNP
jgi:tRNA dimethylallyltransferase